MDTPRILAVVTLLTVGTLTACGGDEPEAVTPTSTEATASTPTSTEATRDQRPSTECLSAMSTAADEIDPVLADPLITDTAYACETAEEWNAALQEYPGAMGLNERADLSGSLEIVCFNSPDAPACAGAE